MINSTSEKPATAFRRVRNISYREIVHIDLNVAETVITVDKQLHHGKYKSVTLSGKPDMQICINYLSIGVLQCLQRLASA